MEKAWEKACDDMLDRAIHNSPPPLDDVGGDVSDMLDKKDPQRALPPNPKQAYGDKKVPLHLVPAAGIVYEAMALKEGARKYGPYNWRDNAVEAETYIGATLRHVLAWQDGEEYDPESDVHHLGLAKACLGILIDARVTGNLLDNRPPPGETGELIRQFTSRQE